MFATANFLADQALKLQEENARLKREMERLRADAGEARAAVAIVREIAAAVPLKHTLQATRTGATLVEFVKQAMQNAASPIPKEEKP